MYNHSQAVRTRTADLGRYTQERRAALEALLASPEWRAALSGGLVDEVARTRQRPPRVREFVPAVVGPLLAANRARAAEMVAAGCRDREALLEALSRWPADVSPPIAFLGLNLTAECNLSPRCVYCNQHRAPALLSTDDWVAIVAEAVAMAGASGPRADVARDPVAEDGSVPVAEDGGAEDGSVPGAEDGGAEDGSAPGAEDGGAADGADPVAGRAAPGPYVYITGGEPLVLGEALWGPEGLVPRATRLGAGLSINTNATLITPEVALRLVQGGLLRLHVSLDTLDPAVHAELRGAPGLDAVLAGIGNIQLARELAGADYPVIHINCVVTRRNVRQLPEWFGSLLDLRRQTADPQDPLYHDLLPHLIPVGGTSNAALRPTADAFTQLYTEGWAEVERIWEAHLASLGATAAQRKPLFGYFTSPYQRVDHYGGLEGYAADSAAGRYSASALTRHCTVAPTQASVAPDGLVYRCGAQAIGRRLPLGEWSAGQLEPLVRDGIADLSSFPDPSACAGCALATLYINQAAERRLVQEIDELLEPNREHA